MSLIRRICGVMTVMSARTPTTAATIGAVATDSGRWKVALKVWRGQTGSRNVCLILLNVAEAGFEK